MADQFHDVCGAQAAITNGGRVAERKTPESSFDKGIVFSKRPLKGRFEVRIRRKVGAWSGSIRIGVTSRSPESATIPNSSTALKGGAVILSGRNVIVDGRTQYERGGKRGCVGWAWFEGRSTKSRYFTNRSNVNLIFLDRKTILASVWRAWRWTGAWAWKSGIVPCIFILTGRIRARRRRSCAVEIAGPSSICTGNAWKSKSHQIQIQPKKKANKKMVTNIYQITV